MINCPNANFKNYIFKLQHENQDLKQEIFKLKNYISILEKANDIA